jgi:hypothetical protein
LAKYSDWWSHSLLPGYDFRSSGHPTFGYYASAVIGTMLIAGVILVAFKIVQLARRRADAGEPT